jgi:uncharacterized RDD family membrane protein YckC
MGWYKSGSSVLDSSEEASQFTLHDFHKAPTFRPHLHITPHTNMHLSFIVCFFSLVSLALSVPVAPPVPLPMPGGIFWGAPSDLLGAKASIDFVIRVIADLIVVHRLV